MSSDLSVGSSCVTRRMWKKCAFEDILSPEGGGKLMYVYKMNHMPQTCQKQSFSFCAFWKSMSNSMNWKKLQNKKSFLLTKLTLPFLLKSKFVRFACQTNNNILRNSLSSQPSFYTSRWWLSQGQSDFALSYIHIKTEAMPLTGAKLSQIYISLMDSTE